MHYYNILTWGDNGEDWISINDLLVKNPAMGIELASLEKMALHQIKDLRERLECLYPGKFFLVVKRKDWSGQDHRFMLSSLD